MELLSLFILFFLAFSSSKNKTIVYLVDGIVVNEEVDNRGIKYGDFKWVLLAKKLIIGLTNYISY